jgi:hypothetical protein
MSGPKVVRIVTREEIEAICRRHLANGREASNELRRCAKRYDVLDDRLQADIERRCVALERLLAEQRFGELQKQAPLVIGFFANEVEGIRARAVAAAETARSKRRRIVAAAKTLISAMESSGRTAPAALRDIATRGDFVSDSEMAEMQSILNRNFSSLAPPKRSPPSEASRQLANRLGEDEAPRAFSDWLATQSTGTEKDDARLDSLMAEIDALDGPQAAQPFLERAAAIRAETSASRRALLTDSLVLDLSERSRRRRSEAVVAEKLRALRAYLSTLGVVEAQTMELEISSMLDSSTFDRAEAVMARGTALVEKETAKLAAAARRRAVLEGLAELGYEVSTSMAAAWARDGRVVVRKPGATDYGVELGAPADISRLQVRLVGSDRPSTPRHAERDRDMETIWCSEFDRLQKQLGAHGGEVVIERALEPGALPLHAVTFDERPTTVTVRQELRRQQ